MADEPINPNAGLPTEGDPALNPSALAKEGIPQTIATEGYDAPQEGDPPESIRIGDRVFANQEEVTAWFDAGQPDEAGPYTDLRNAEAALDAEEAEAAKDDLEGDKDDAPKDEVVTDPERPWFTPDTRTDEEIVAALTEQGGIYAHEAYRPAALEFQRTGAVSDETLAATAEGLGVPLDFARNWVDTQIALRAAAHVAETRGAELAGVERQPTAEEVKQANEIKGVFGGDEGYKAFEDWAKDGLTAGQKATYNTLLQAGDAEGAKTLLGVYKQTFDAAGAGKAPRDVTKESSGGRQGSAAGAVQPFASEAEQTKAVNDPRYDQDEAYRKEIMARMNVSPDWS